MLLFWNALRSRQSIRSHRRRQLAVVPLNHPRTVAHLPAQSVYVRALVQQFQRGVDGAKFQAVPRPAERALAAPCIVVVT